MNRPSIVILLLAYIGCSHTDDHNVSASGTIEATEVTVSAKVGGQLLKLFVDEGSRVSPGDTLALIDQSDLRIQSAQAKANAAAADAQLKLILRGAREEDLSQAQAQFNNAEADLHRMENLFKEGTVTQKQLDDARTRFTVAEQTYEKLKRGARREEIDAARARLDQAVAQVEAIQKKISDAVVTAPLSGIITQKSMEEGEVALPNGALVTISRLDPVHLTIFVSEKEMARVKIGQGAHVIIDGQPDKPLPGRVIYISSIAEFTPRNVQTKEDRTKLVFGVKIEVPNPDHVLKPGMPADAVIQAD